MTYDDFYIFTYFNKETNKVSTAYAQDIEGFRTIAESDTLKVLTYFNITGKDIKIGKTEVLNSIEVV